jgi:uncharacterized protein YfiM (DUF2279 family)
MTKTLATLFLCLALSAHADDHKPPVPVTPSCTDCWNGADKKQHFAVSFVLGIATANQWPDNKPLSIGVAMIPGIAKEISDSQKGGSGFSGKDIAWDFLGALTGVYGTHWVLRRSGGTNKVAYATEF